MENALSLAEFDEIVLAHADEDIDDVLEHYGRLGMKWYQHIYGEEDGRARYNDKWKAKESSKVRKRANKQYVGAGKSAHRLFENEKPYMARQLLKARNLSADLAIKELTRIANMSTEDILKETKEKHKWQAKNLIASIFVPGGILQSSRLQKDKPINTSDFKTKSRTGQTQNEVILREQRRQEYSPVDYYAFSPQSNFQDTMNSLGITDSFLRNYDEEHKDKIKVPSYS